MANFIHSAIVIAIVIALQIRRSIQETVPESDKLLESNLVDGCDAEVFDPSKTYANHLPRFCGVTENYLTWHATLQYKGLSKDSPLFNCSGTLISKRYVLTAAHCASSDVPPYKVRLGMPTIREKRNWRYFGIECIIRHQGYKEHLKRNDIALIRLATEVKFDDYIYPVCLPATSELRPARPEPYVINRWGYLIDGVDRISIFFVNRSECYDWLESKGIILDANQFCMEERAFARNPCRTPPGAIIGYYSFILFDPKKIHQFPFVQMAFVSFEMGCGNVYQVFTNVSSHMDWITANMKP